jgi:hypothetical protein
MDGQVARGQVVGGKPTALPPKTFEKAIEEAFASDAREKLGPGQPGLVSAPANPAETTTGGESSSAAGKVPWSEIVSSAAIEDEIKSQVAATLEGVKSPSAYNSGGNKVVGRNFTVVAAMFQVVSQYDGQIRWKNDSLAFAALFGRAGANSSKVNSPEAFNEAKARAADLQELIGGGKIEASPPEGDATWAQLVARPLLMQRMDESYQQRLKGWTGNQSDFDANLESLEREAQILAALAKIIQDESFDYSDAETYRQYARELQSQALNIASAARLKDRGTAESAAAGVYKACDACHGEFRGN